MMNPAARNLLCGVSEHEAFAPGERLQGQGRERGYSRERNRTGKEREGGMEEKERRESSKNAHIRIS